MKFTAAAGCAKRHMRNNAGKCGSVLEVLIRRRFTRYVMVFVKPCPQVNQLTALTAKWTPALRG